MSDVWEEDTWEEWQAKMTRVANAMTRVALTFFARRSFAALCYDDQGRITGETLMLDPQTCLDEVAVLQDEDEDKDDKWSSCSLILVGPNHRSTDPENGWHWERSKPDAA